MANSNRPFSFLHTPADDAQGSQWSLHTPVDDNNPHSFQSTPQSPHYYPQQGGSISPVAEHPSENPYYQGPPQQHQHHQQQPYPQAPSSPTTPTIQNPYYSAHQSAQYTPPPSLPSPRFSPPPGSLPGSPRHSQIPQPSSPRFSPPPGSLHNPHSPHVSPPSSPRMSQPPEEYQMATAPQHTQYVPGSPPPPISSPAPTYHTQPSSTPIPESHPQSLATRPPVPPEPIHTPAYNPSESTGPKTPIYTPGAASGPNGGVHAPGQIGHPNQQHSVEHYHHGLCDCFSDISTCCLGCWCPCMLYSRTYHRLKTAPNSNLNEYSSCNSHCAIFCVAAPVSWILTTLQRMRIRESYRLEGSIASDCVKAYCCVMCTLVQDDREVKDREDEKRRFAGPGSGVVGDQGYRRQSGMTYG